MKKLFLFFLFNSLILNLFGQTPAKSWRLKIAPEILASMDLGESADVLLVFKEKADLRAAQTLKTKSEKARFVFSRLQETAARAQHNALKMLQENGASANTLFLVNALAVEKANASLLNRLAELPEIEAITSDPWVEFMGPAQATNDAGNAADRDAVEWGIAKIQAPEVWAMGYSGQGITVGGADTGFDWAHPAIQGKYRGWTGDVASSQHNYNWHDAIHDFSPLNNDTLGNPGINPCGLNSPVPCDDNSHGTHTMGTMTGDDGQGNQIGVAPAANWIACRNMERGWGKPSSYIECFQWFLAPTDLGGQNPDPAKAPHVVNNSWYCAVEEGCTDFTVNELLQAAVTNLKASGVVVVVSNGNFGSNCSTTLGPPAYFEESFSIGSTRSDDFISGFSSRGPVLIDNSYRMKPNVSAPGENVRSSTPGGNYANYSGTSMAGPHVAGLVALVLSANPALAGHVDDIEDIVEQTAIYFADTLDCGTSSGIARPNHAYGWGRVDALGAVQAALQWAPTVSTVSPILPTAVVSPNPLQEAAIFTFENLSGESLLEIFNAEGKQVFAKKWLAQNRESLRVSFENQAVGVYFWKLKSGNGVASGKLVKE
ncbi:MAG: S8 family peptidase [Saprospiraceae bacterium]|nr:S8 family peptidase [Saprospiraceae bacterium]